MLDIFFLIPFAGLSLFVFGGFLLAKRKKEKWWYVFSAGLFMMLISDALNFMFPLSFSVNPVDSVTAYIGPPELFVRLLTILSFVGLWVSAISLTIIALRCKDSSSDEES